MSTVFFGGAGVLFICRINVSGEDEDLKSELLVPSQEMSADRLQFHLNQHIHFNEVPIK